MPRPILPTCDRCPHCGSSNVRPIPGVIRERLVITGTGGDQGHVVTDRPVQCGDCGGTDERIRRPSKSPEQIRDDALRGANACRLASPSQRPRRRRESMAGVTS